MLIDTHCHIHESDYSMPASEVIDRAVKSGVNQMICVGTSEDSSAQAIEFVKNHSEVYAAIGVHPHETKDGFSAIARLASDSPKKLIAIGEIGLDYFYTHSPRDVQIRALEAQIDIALKHNLPVIFHVREAFDDFWPIFDNFHGIRGVVHSFTDSDKNLTAALSRGLYVGVNGISTFTKDEAQRDVFASIPLGKLLLETDAPFLTPAPFRGKVNEPAYVKNIAEFHAKVRQLSYNEISQATTTNARALFAL